MLVNFSIEGFAWVQNHIKLEPNPIGLSDVRHVKYVLKKNKVHLANKQHFQPHVQRNFFHFRVPNENADEL